MAKTKSLPGKKAKRTSVKKNGQDNLGDSLSRWYASALSYTPHQLANKAVWAVVLWALAPLALGMYLSTLIVPQPAVGVINLDTGISRFTADFIGLQIEYARNHPDIKAVVIEIDTPGGSVVPTQELYYQLLDLRKTVPVVSAIDGLAASGGYYLAMATDPIFAKPSSTVGNIGVWGIIPPDLAVNDLILASGPFKLTATNQAEFVREIEGIKREFLETVKAGRGERLAMKDHEVITGLAYSGREAIELGLIDYLGSTTEAVAMAAEIAGIRNYRVIDIEMKVLEAIFGDSNPFFEEWVYSRNPLSEGFALPPGAYMLYDLQLGGLP